MTTDPRARFWAARSAFEADGGSSTVPFALVARATFDGLSLGRAPAALPARPALGVKGMPALRLPLLLDATPLHQGSAKGWAAAARAAAAVGAPLLLSPAQCAAQATVLKAAGVPLFLRVGPADALAPEAAGSAAALGLSIASEAGAPAVMASDALPGLVEALRAVTEYRAPVFLMAAPGRVPPAQALAAAAGAGARALCVGEPERHAFPLAALIGHGATARSADPPMPAFVLTDAVADGLSFACALSAGHGLAASAFPLRVAAAEEAATDADWKATGDRLAAALRVLWEDAQRASAAAGVRDPRDLSFENLRALTYDAAALSGARLAGYDERLPWWAH